MFDTSNQLEGGPAAQTLPPTGPALNDVLSRELLELAIFAAWQRARAAAHRSQTPPLWDGRAAIRIVDILRELATAASPAHAEALT